MSPEQLNSESTQDMLKSQVLYGFKSESIVSYTTAVKLGFGAVQLVALTELFIKIRAIYS
jgi:hypothetical protein